MSNKYTLSLKSFRSIRSAEIDIAPLTVVYGPNGSGKSSLIYGLMTLKNFLTNPNHDLSCLLSYSGLNLGGFDEVVFNQLSDETIDAALSISSPGRGMSKFTLGMGKTGGKSAICVDDRDTKMSFDMALNVPFPYRLNRSDNVRPIMEWYAWWEEDYDFTYQTEIDIGWNGISLNINHVNPIGWGENDIAIEFLKWANKPMETAKDICFVPLSRELASPVCGATTVTSMISGDEDIASILAADPALEYKVSDYMERVANRQIRTRPQVGTSSFTIDSVPGDGQEPISVINEGSGFNQLVSMLTVSLQNTAKIVLIEDPEIHLHPSTVRNLAHAFVDIVSNNDRRFLISTHSETFVISLLSQIAVGKINVDDVSFILAEKENGESKFTKQEAEANGQIKGGLKSFIASEFEDIAIFLGLDAVPTQS